MMNGTDDLRPTAPLESPATNSGPNKLKRWAVPTGALILGLVIGGAAGGSDPTQSDEYQALQAELATAQDELQATDERAQAAEARADAAEEATRQTSLAAANDASNSASEANPSAGPSASPAPPAEASNEVDFSMPSLIGMDLQSAQNAIQAYDVFFSTSHDLLGSRQQVVDSNWTVCTQNIPAGQQVTGDAEGLIDLGVVKRGEGCP